MTVSSKDVLKGTPDIFIEKCMDYCEILKKASWLSFDILI